MVNGYRIRVLLSPFTFFPLSCTILLDSDFPQCTCLLWGPLLEWNPGGFSFETSEEQDCFSPFNHFYCFSCCYKISPQYFKMNYWRRISHVLLSIRNFLMPFLSSPTKLFIHICLMALGGLFSLLVF